MHASATDAKLSADLEDVRQKLRALIEAGRVDEALDLVLALLAQVRDNHTTLSVRLHNALRALYGRKSEKMTSDQLALLFEQIAEPVPPGAQDIVAQAQADKDTSESDTVEQPAEPARPARGRRGRSPLPAHLPREERELRVPEPERRCGKCGADKQCIGWLVEGEMLEFVPAQFKVIVPRREKLACPNCPAEGVCTAPSDKVMERGRPGPGLLAHVVVSKGQDSLPLYRQCQMYERAGVSIAPSTLGEWFGFACEVVAPIAHAIRERVLESFVIRADDTGIRVLDRAHPKGVKLGHLWGYVGDDGLVAFDYTPSWEAKGPLAFLAQFRGFVQGDGYAGFKAGLERARGQPIIAEERRLGCGMHVRRKFEQAADAGDARGAVALAYFRKLYDVERACKDEALGAEGRKQRRDELSLPVLDELYAWIHQLHPRLVPGDKLHTATRYAINQEAVLRRCFDDGRFEIDNGEVERQLRRVALGRKNFLFAGSDKGAVRLATAYTLLGSCHMRGLNPLAYLADVIDKVQNGWPKSRLVELLPDAWTPPVVPSVAPASAPS